MKPLREGLSRGRPKSSQFPRVNVHEAKARSSSNHCAIKAQHSVGKCERLEGASPGKASRATVIRIDFSRPAPRRNGIFYVLFLGFGVGGRTLHSVCQPMDDMVGDHVICSTGL